ncbi:MAG: aspartate kinase, partial [Bacillota bacterium]|nr:aspartate kinase [Bacillota bacterium]
GDARIITVETDYLKSLLAMGVVPVVAGFQGASDGGEITTLGRGGSDTTAAAIGVALAAKCIEIYTDVEGIMTADPRIVPEARVLEALDYSEVFQMASQGSKVIHPRAVELAMQRNIPLIIKSTFSDAPGTTITNTVLYEQKRGKYVTAVAHITRVAQVIIETPGDDGSIEYDIFHRLADAGVSVDLINVSPGEKKFIITEDVADSAFEALKDLGVDVSIRPGCAKISVIGAGMRGIPGVMAKVVAALREAQVRILQTSDPHLTISVLTDEQDLERATKALHRHFNLGNE